MAGQETLTADVVKFNPLDHGLWRRHTDGDNISHGAWLRASAEGGYVGTCRTCGGNLAPRAPEEHGLLTWYEATCVACHHTYAAPAHRWEHGGRLLRRSSAHHEMPTGWFAHRGLPAKPKPGEAA